MGASTHSSVLDMNVPLTNRDRLLLICKEIDEDTPEAETDAFIYNAHSYLCGVFENHSLTQTLLATIETYLAAHFAVLSYPAVQRESVGPLTTSYFGKLELGLQNTRYGQMAISMDPTGRLKRLSDGDGVRDVKMRSLGGGILRQTP